jgi:hypothetical protein
LEVLNSQEIEQALTLLVEVFEEFHIPYYIGDSVASSVLGEPRATFDIDVVAAIQPGHVSLLVKHLESTYYIDAQMIRDAIRNRSSFNIIYLDTMFKIDIFIPKSRPYAQQELRRTRLVSIEEGTRPFYISSPEDIILNKLDWYKMGDCTSKRQWADILGVLHRQKQTLDFAYLRNWAINLRVADLLEQALIDAEQ